MVAYTMLYDFMESLRDTFRASFAASPQPPATHAIRVGEELAMEIGGIADMCCDGTVAVLALQTTQVPGTEEAGLPVSMFQDFAVVVLRCSPSIDDMGRFPDEQVQTDSVKLLLDDRERLLATMAVYVENAGFASGEYLNPTVNAVEAQGGCCGNAFSFTVALTQDC